MRVFLALLLGLTLATAGNPSTVRGNRPAVQEDEQKLSPEEEQEARALVARLEERLLATNDFGPIVDELFVGDFQERLWQAPHNSLPWYFVDKFLLGYAGPAELRRFYVASVSFYRLFFRLEEAAKALKKQSENSEKELKAADIMSQEIINVLLGNPTIAELAKEFREDDENESTRGADDTDEMGIIKTQRQLEDVSSTLEKANELMRKRLADMLASLQASRAGGVNEKEGEKDSPYFSPTTLDEDEYGFPQGTRVIHAEVPPFCVYLVRVDGRLRILSAAPTVD